jgi:DNA-binding transcriptional regulator of glucitol operon
MKKVSLAILVSLSALTGAAYAQTDNGVMMSTDPAKAADVEQRAQDLQAKQQAMESQQSMPAMHHKMEHKKAPHHMKAAKPEAASQ